MNAGSALVHPAEGGEEPSPPASRTRLFAALAGVIRWWAMLGGLVTLALSVMIVVMVCGRQMSHEWILE